MTTTKRPFKVIIVGGSVAGLTTALLMQSAGIDFIVLEARDIAPAVGASLGLWPNGFRILDQLGVYEQIQSLCVNNGDAKIFGRDGKFLQGSQQTEFVIETFGYPSCFLDRQWLIQVLYDNIKDKTKVLTRVKITKIDQSDEGVVVVCADGTAYDGDIVVGADGVHSFVRTEMWRHMEEDDPTLLPPGEKEAVTVTFSAMFGIASPVPGVPAGSVNMCHHDNAQFMTVGGKDDRCFFFIFKRLDRVYHAPDLPKFTESDRDAVAEFHKNDKINGDATFGDIWNRRIAGTYLPLEESAFTKYAYKRIIMVGDSIHKPTPASGQGGNGAIESAAVFANLLVQALSNGRESDDDLKLSGKGAAKLSETYSTMRMKRMDELIKASHNMNQYSLMAPNRLWLLEVILPWIPSSLTRKGMEAQLLAPISGGPHVEFLPLPDKKGKWK
ncbi:hypothetical protein BJ742DRAFT_713703 [Cladochytrium replicatum]|nr:hypothetical protein BJ742DRAFT_713703 [Cladochytrium replicatum]